ncbi:cbb3-type cytochrome oxidase assembly protein CcoS [Sulfurovum sp. bin170]|uniref:cbb3-type cytochrome oxidase assembly protein CcoS n=1 Tax=Sulfurovum sp. bin170 TaxID=2695268 RepID=UPI00210603F0|nr:cbb3-type cytochrome oxidase assembly protein CcoS [Sulfurovum sp. bin170]
MNNILILELAVGIIVSFTLLGIFIWAVKGGQFDDSKKAMDGLLFDSEEDLRDAVKKEKKVKALKEKKAKKTS